MPWLWRFFSRISFVPSPSRVESCIHFVRICKRVKSFLKSRDNIYYIYYLIQRGVIVARIQYRLSEMFYFVQNDIFRTTISSDSFPSNNLSQSYVRQFFESYLILIDRSLDENERKGKWNKRKRSFKFIPYQRERDLPYLLFFRRDARGRPGRLIHGPAGEPGIRTDKVVKSGGEEARGGRWKGRGGLNALPSARSSGERNTGPLISRYLNYRLAARTN